MVRVVAEAFLGDMPSQIERLEELVAAEDVLQISVQAHKIKGAAANVGGTALSAMARQMERTCKAGDLGTIRQEQAKLAQRFAQLKSAMEETLF